MASAGSEYEGSVWLARVDVRTAELKFNDEEFLKLMEKVGNRDVSIISICGAKRTGKSYTLNSFLKYLNFEGEEGFLTKKLDKGFLSINTSEAVTKGIRAWPEPFFLKRKEDSKEIALILLDTQGNSDRSSDTAEDSKLFALSTILSSTIIYNTMKQIEENEFQVLESFIYFANLGVQKNEEKSSELIFLIRDFAFKNYNLGKHDENTPKEDEKNFLKKEILPNKTCASQRQHTKEHIQSCFGSISAYLLPYPGKELEKNDNDTVIDDEFKQHMKKFCEKTLNPNLLLKKKICGKVQTGIDLKMTIPDLVHKMKEKDFTVDSLTTFLVRNNEQNNYSRAKTLYDNSTKELLEANKTGVDPKILNKSHKKYRLLAFDYFKNAERFKDDKIYKEFYEKLDNAIEKKHKKVCIENDSRRSWWRSLGAAGVFGVLTSFLSGLCFPIEIIGSFLGLGIPLGLGIAAFTLTLRYLSSFHPRLEQISTTAWKGQSYQKYIIGFAVLFITLFSPPVLSVILILGGVAFFSPAIIRSIRLSSQSP